MTEKPNFYAIIPASVRYDENLTGNAKLLYGEITALSSKEGHCWASDGYFCELYGVGRSTIQNWLKALEENNYIKREVVYKDGARMTADRYIRLLDTHVQKTGHPLSKKLDTPIPNNWTHNNTSINNTSISKEGVDIFEGYNFSPAMKEHLEVWLSYKKERKESYKPTGLTAFLSGVKNRLEKHEEADIIALIDDCMANNWKGIIWDKLPPPKPKVHIMPKQETEPQTLEEIFGVEYD